MRRVKLEIFEQDSVLRITADKTTAEYAADDIEEVLGSTHAKNLNLKPWVPLLERQRVPKDKGLIYLYAPNDLKHISELTRTFIESAGGAGNHMVCPENISRMQPG